MARCPPRQVSWTPRELSPEERWSSSRPGPGAPPGREREVETGPRRHGQGAARAAPSLPRAPPAGTRPPGPLSPRQRAPTWPARPRRPPLPDAAASAPLPPWLPRRRRALRPRFPSWGSAPLARRRRRGTLGAGLAGPGWRESAQPWGREQGAGTGGGAGAGREEGEGRGEGRTEPGRRGAPGAGLERRDRGGVPGGEPGAVRACARSACRPVGAGCCWGRRRGPGGKLCLGWLRPGYWSGSGGDPGKDSQIQIPPGGGGEAGLPRPWGQGRRGAEGCPTQIRYAPIIFRWKMSL